jgi:hypothetical protein
VDVDSNFLEGEKDVRHVEFLEKGPVRLSVEQENIKNLRLKK